MQPLWKQSQYTKCPRQDQSLYITQKTPEQVELLVILSLLASSSLPVTPSSLFHRLYLLLFPLLPAFSPLFGYPLLSSSTAFLPTSLHPGSSTCCRLRSGGSSWCTWALRRLSSTLRPEGQWRVRVSTASWALRSCELLASKAKASGPGDKA